MLFKQFLDDDLGCASYLIADEESREAILVDPAYDISRYLAEAERAGLRLTRVLETHTHADHVSGHGRLGLEHGLTVAVHPAANAEYPHEPLADGAEMRVGSVAVRVLHTPGHRPEHCCFVVEDAVLTGDSLFVGATARPDLAVAEREGAEGLFHSLRRLAELPEHFRVFPGHVAGSLCGTNMSSETSSTIGTERQGNPALAKTTVEEFVCAATALSTPRPPNMELIVALNRGRFLGEPPKLEPVAAPNGSIVLDVRTVDAFAAGHVAGAINIPLASSGFGTKAGFLVQPGERIVLHASSPSEAEHAARRLHAVGFLDLGGYLAEPASTEALEPLDVGELERLLREGSVELLDVREREERDGGYIPGSRHIPYRLLRTCLGELPDEGPIATICESGVRASIAASIVAAAGREARPVLRGGIVEWEARGFPMVAFRRCGSL